MKLEKIGLVISDYDLERGNEFIGLKDSSCDRIFQEENGCNDVGS